MIYNTRFAGDIHYFLWSQGNDILTLVDHESLDMVMIRDFWKISGTDESLSPISLAGNINCRKLLGVGRAAGGEYYLVFTELNSDNSVNHIATQNTKRLKHISSILCLERSITPDVILVGGSENGWAVVGQVSMKRNPKLISHIILNTGNYQSVYSIKRISGKEFTIVGCLAHVLVLSIDRLGELQLVKEYPDIARNEINAIAIYANSSYFLSQIDGQITSITFNESNGKHSVLSEGGGRFSLGEEKRGRVSK